MSELEENKGECTCKKRKVSDLQSTSSSVSEKEEYGRHVTKLKNLYVSGKWTVASINSLLNETRGKA